MHYSCEVILKSCENIKEDIERLMAPYYEGATCEPYVRLTKEELIDIERRSIARTKRDCWDKYIENPAKYEQNCPNKSHIKFLTEEFKERLSWTEEQLYQEAIKYLEPDQIAECGGELSTQPKDTFWDWWQIGGRWTGAKVKGYNPAEDPKNKEECYLCDGTGKRLDMRVKDGCNGCQGTGRMLKWPTRWIDKGNICKVEDIAYNLTAYTLIVEGLEAEHQEKWDGSEFIKQGFDGNIKKRLNELGITEGFAVTVDYHC